MITVVVVSIWMNGEGHDIEIGLNEEQYALLSKYDDHADIRKIISAETPYPFEIEGWSVVDQF